MNGRMDQRTLVTKFVVGWEAMSELALGIPGGGPDPVPFDADLWAEWIADHPEQWDAITAAVVESYRTHRTAREEVAKNSPPGSAA